MGKFSVALACAAVLGVAALPAQSAMVTFDDVLPVFVGQGDSFTSGDFRFTLGADFGGVTDAASFVFGTAPTGNATQFYAGFNDSGLRMSRDDSRLFALGSLDYGFIPALPGFYALGDEPGALVIQGERGGVTTTLGAFGWGGADGDGLFAFTGADLSGFADTFFESVSFFACTYDGAGGCAVDAANLNQFALDNIDNRVPEPASLALAFLALGVAGAVRRRAA